MEKRTHIDQSVAGVMIENEKKANENYRRTHPHSLIPVFEQELHNIGFAFEVSSQTLGFMPKYKSVISPIALKYYCLARNRAEHDEQNHFLRFLAWRGNEEVVAMLLDDFCAIDTPSLTRWFIADALYQIRSAKYVDEYIRIIADPIYGKNRQMLILLIGKLKAKTAIPVLVDLLDDKDVCLQTIISLGEFRDENLRSYFERFQDVTHAGWRKYSRIALKKLGHTTSP